MSIVDRLTLRLDAPPSSTGAVRKDGEKRRPGGEGSQTPVRKTQTAGTTTYLTGESNDLPLLHDEQRPLERMLAVALTRNELLDERSVTRAPTNRQSSPDLTLDPLDLLVELTSGKTFDRTGRDCVHGRELEEADGLVDVMRLDDGRERDLGYRLGDSDDGLQLSAKKSGSASVES